MNVMNILNILDGAVCGESPEEGYFSVTTTLLFRSKKDCQLAFEYIETSIRMRPTE